jgi:hypothetical protein
MIMPQPHSNQQKRPTVHNWYISLRFCRVSCKGGNHDACSTCWEGGLGCDNPSHRRVLSDVQKEKAVVDVVSLYPQALPSTSFARHTDPELLRINQRNQPQAEAEKVLTVLYDFIFDDISRDPHKQSINEALDIVYHALRALTVVDLLDAMSLSQGSVVADVMQLRTWTGDLIRVSTNAGGPSSVQFFNDSLIRYLHQKKNVLFPQGHSALATACLQVLLAQGYLPELDPGEDDELPELDPVEQEITLELDRVKAAKSLVRYASGKSTAASSLYGYAACLWGRHLLACSPNSVLEAMAIRYLQDDKKLKLGCLTAYILQPKYMAYGFDTGGGLAPVHVCSIFGLTNLLLRLPPAELDKPVAYTGQTPLTYACGMGHVDTVMLLLKFGADPNPSVTGELSGDAGPFSRSGLASVLGHKKPVQLLLDADVDARFQHSAAETSRESPLIYASRMGHTHIARLLLKEAPI